MRILTNLLLALLTISFIGCSKTTPKIVHVEKQLPKWYLNPPLKSEKYLYGVGDGINREEAIKSALDDLVSKLGISISSNYKSSTKTKKGYRESFAQTSSSDISSEVSKIRISNYEVIESQKQKYNHFVTLVRSDKKLFKKDLLKSLNQIYSKIEDEQKTINDSHVLSRYSFYKYSQTKLAQTLSTLLVLNSLDENFDDRPYLKTIQIIDADSSLLLKNISISFSSSKESNAFINVIKSALSETKIAISNKKQTNKNNLEISLSHKTYESISHGIYIIKVSVLLDVRDFKNNILHTEQIDVVGYSPQSKEISMNDAVKNFEIEVDKREIMRIIGVN